MGHHSFLRFIRVFRDCVAIFPFLLLSASLGQSNPDVQTASSATVVKNVDEVSIDFVVRNRKKPVLDVKPTDVVVIDDGSIVKLSDLRLVTGHSGENHLVTFLFEPLDPSAATNARDVAKKILRLIPQKDFSLAVFNIDKRLQILQEFTANRDEIQKAISAATNEEGAQRDGTAAIVEKRVISAVQSVAGQALSPASAYDRTLQEAMLASLTESQHIARDQHTSAALAGLLGLVRAQTRIRGRKLVIYFTEGLPLEADARETLRSIAGAANRAEVSIYVINKEALDTKTMDGLLAASVMGGVAAFNRMNPTPAQIAAQNPGSLSAGMAAAIPVASGPGLQSQISDQITRVEGEGLAGSNDPMAAMATGTGGAYIYSQDDLKRPFRQAVADLTTYYEASYIPPGLVYNGKFHQTSVKALRRGLKVQSRAGYFAVPFAGGTRPFEVPLMRALSEAQLPTDVKLRTAIFQLGDMTTGNESTLVVEVPTSSLEARSDVNANLRSWHVSIVSEVKDKSGTVVEHFSEDIPGHSAVDDKDGTQSPATMQRHFALSPGQYTLETAVLDRTSGKMGGERTKFEVRSSASGPFLSDLALVRQIDSSAEELDPFEPLRYQHGKIIPNVSGQVVPGTRQLSLFFLVRPDTRISSSAMLEMQVLRNGELLGQVPLQLPKELTEAFPYIASIRTSSLPAGSYEVRLVLAQGEGVAEREASFTIAGPELANAALEKPEAVKQDKEPEMLTDSVQEENAVVRSKREPLVITALPTDSVARPSNEDLDEIIGGARKNALNYSVKLPNFLCVEITDRSVDSSGNGRWRRKDSFGELLRYVGNQETRTTLEVNGRPSTVNRTEMDGPISLGEFGHLLSLVFQPSSKAEFHWKETDALANGMVQVFEYRIHRNNDSMVLSDSNRKVYAGFHGLAYIDSSTQAIRRITMEADDLPPDFSIHSASIAVDYDYVSVGAHDYLMPVRGTIRVKRGKHEVDLNQMVFQDYRRFASQAKVIFKP
jgi:VWFA-related protein